MSEKMASLCFQRIQTNKRTKSNQKKRNLLFNFNGSQREMQNYHFHSIRNLEHLKGNLSDVLEKFSVFIKRNGKLTSLRVFIISREIF